MKKTLILIFAIIITFYTVIEIKAEEKLKIVTWNLQTFFDAKKSGNEYKEFTDDKSLWCKDIYIKRLQRTAKIFNMLNADILVLEEVENENVLYDLYNQQTSSFYFKKVYKYAAFSKMENSCLGVAVLSRFPISNVKIHLLDIRTTSENTALRPIMQLDISKNNNNITIIANHWKSKLGKDNGQFYRERQKKQLVSIVNSIMGKNGDAKIIACGDFNTDLSTSDLENEQIMSAWDFLKTDNNIGSYCYKNSWSKIDNIFVTKNINIIDFRIEDRQELKNSKGYPKRFLIKTQNGYSDHFPLSCIIKY